MCVETSTRWIMSYLHVVTEVTTTTHLPDASGVTFAADVIKETLAWWISTPVDDTAISRYVL